MVLTTSETQISGCEGSLLGWWSEKRTTANIRGRGVKFGRN